MSAFTEFDAFYPWEGRYALSRDLIWDIGWKGSPWQLCVPEGRRFDLSVPRSLRWLQSPHDLRLLPAAAVHDELLRQGVDAASAASEFRRACRARGVGPWRAWTLFLAVLVWTARPDWMRVGGARP